MGKWFYFRNITRAYSEIWSLKYNKERKESHELDVLSSGGGVCLLLKEKVGA
jgi:hypothetical protein